MKSFLINSAGGFFLLGVVTVAPAQSVWNFQISDAGGGNSLVTWNVTGDLTTVPGPVFLGTATSVAAPTANVVPTPGYITVAIDAPGIFAGSFSADGTGQPISTPDGSYFATGDIYFPIQEYSATAVPGQNDIFSLTSHLPGPSGWIGNPFHYVAGTQSIVIPIDFSNFNPGTYSSQESEFSTPLTVNLTVLPVPEPSPNALSMAGCLGTLLLFGSRKIAGAR